MSRTIKAKSAVVNANTATVNAKHVTLKHRGLGRRRLTVAERRIPKRERVHRLAWGKAHRAITTIEQLSKANNLSLSEVREMHEMVSGAVKETFRMLATKVALRGFKF